MTVEHEFTLGDAFDLQMGKTPSRSNPLYWGGENKWISIADIKDKCVSKTKECISDLAVEETGIKVVPKGTLIMSFKLSVGKVAFAAEDMYTNEAIMAFIDKGKYPVDMDYLYHYLSNQDWRKGTNKAVKGLTLNKKSLSARKIVLPSLDIQRDAANTLNLLDRAIQLCQQLLETTDMLVKVRFIEMFGNPANNPNHWNTMTFRQAGVRLSDGPFGSNLKTEHYTDTGVRVIRLGNIGVGRFIDNDKVFISFAHYERIKKYTCSAGEIVIGTLGEPNLRACIVPEFVGVAVNKADCVHYVPKAELLNNQFVCHYINCPETLLLAAGMVHGQTRSRISSGQIANMPIFIPPMELQEQFASFVAQTDKSRLAVTDCLKKAEFLKSALMQQYFG